MNTPRPATGNPTPQRFPGFDVMGQARHWDAATTATVAARLDAPGELRFFTAEEADTARALCDRLLDQDEADRKKSRRRVPVVEPIDGRLADGLTDGWHYHDMPHDDVAWRRSLAALDADAEAEHGRRFHRLEPDQQDDLLSRIQRQASGDWHGLPAGHVWSLWTRYACTAFYAHPWAWEEIGFAGPAYPQGYKNLGLDARDPREVADHWPEYDPMARPGRPEL
ncbi:gluconate 2-dehydrogenase subunit 3 family protein [Raineyella fluvialis]|uniref:Gluconate 2-dehydrogenase subunit 3 family protein n=2 Tax=Raineyella fluvialis TaxID=2662261 RepID=A0A5Q2FK58_9ACTN|nr:gluconate 2-dehydrogenase subunit 3 family protein [Raineyella fluvialis]